MIKINIMQLQSAADALTSEDESDPEDLPKVNLKRTGETRGIL